MKKFVFSLQALYKYKQTLERLHKGELSVLNAEVNRIRAALQAEVARYEDAKNALAAILQSGKGVISAMREYNEYFKLLTDRIAEFVKELRAAEKKRDECLDKLVAVMKEIKTYDKLREEQYRRYLKEVQAEEEKAINDLVSFTATVPETA